MTPPSEPLRLVTEQQDPTHPTRRVDAKVTCVWTDGDEYEITLTDVDRRWRFTVADASPYPVGSTITLEVPA